MKFKSPAKINLFLRVLNKRPDGYHEIASLFQAVDFCDFLTFELSTSDVFTCSNPHLPLDASNLVLKAVQLFREKSGFMTPLKIHLEKYIPQEAGLGGGSSNAATTLFALNRLANTLFNDTELARLGGQLGSDIAFFFSQGTAFCTGRGEIVQNVSLPPLLFTLCKPHFGSSTPEVYKAFTGAYDIDPLVLLDRFTNNQPDYVNDLENAAFAVNPKLKAFKEALLHSGYEVVLMSGSGSTFICKGECREIIPCDFLQKVTSLSRVEKNWY